MSANVIVVHFSTICTVHLRGSLLARSFAFRVNSSFGEMMQLTSRLFDACKPQLWAKKVPVTPEILLLGSLPLF